METIYSIEEVKASARQLAASNTSALDVCPYPSSSEAAKVFVAEYEWAQSLRLAQELAISARMLRLQVLTIGSAP